MLQIRTYPTLEAMQHLSEVRGKFVQLRWENETWLLFASKDQHKFHNQIVAHFLSEQHIPFHWDSPEALHFALEEMEIIGGGKFMFNWRNKQLLLTDESMVYGRFDDEGLVASIMGTGCYWKAFSIEIR